MKKPYYTKEQTDAMGKAGRDAALAMERLTKALDMLPKKKPPPLWLRRIFS